MPGRADVITGARRVWPTSGVAEIADEVRHQAEWCRPGGLDNELGDEELDRKNPNERPQPDRSGGVAT